MYKYIDIPNDVKFLYEEFETSNSRVLVETGCNYGDRLLWAKQLNYEKMYSCDIFKNRVDFCLELAKKNDFSLVCLNKNSIEFLAEILPTINQRVLFWLDAHGEGGGVPLLEELTLISKHTIRNHDIFIDDIQSYFKSQTDKICSMIKEINTNYQIKFIDTSIKENVLIAKIYE